MPYAFSDIGRLLGRELQHDVQCFLVIDNAKGTLAFGLYLLPEVWELGERFLRACLKSLRGLCRIGV
jgi:hypothetical protein